MNNLFIQLKINKHETRDTHSHHTPDTHTYITSSQSIHFFNRTEYFLASRIPDVIPINQEHNISNIENSYTREREIEPWTVLDDPTWICDLNQTTWNCGISSLYFLGAKMTLCIWSTAYRSKWNRHWTLKKEIVATNVWRHVSCYADQCTTFVETFFPHFRLSRAIVEHADYTVCYCYIHCTFYW